MRCWGKRVSLSLSVGAKASFVVGEKGLSLSVRAKASCMVGGKGLSLSLLGLKPVGKRSVSVGTKASFVVVEKRSLSFCWG